MKPPEVDYTLPENTPKSAMKAIRAKCIDCVCWQPSLIRECSVKSCPIWQFRMGKNPPWRKALFQKSAEKTKDAADLDENDDDSEDIEEEEGR